MTTTSIRNLRHQQQGSIFILLLFLLPIIILFAGFAVDVSYVQRVRSELRAATDISCKAAAATLSKSQDLTAARNAAIAVASQNLVAGQPLTLDPANIEFGQAIRQSDGSFSFVSGGSGLTNAVRILGSRSASSADGPVNAYFGNFYGRTHYEPEVESFAAFVDVDICLVLDRSSSMKEVVDSTSYITDPAYMDNPPDANSRWVALDGAVRQFLAIMNGSAASEQVALVTFASDYDDTTNGVMNLKASVDCNLTYNMSNIESPMDDRLTTIWNGNTNIHEGITFGQNVLTGGSARPLAQKIMVVFTDGVYTDGPEPTPAAVLAADEGITIHTITFSDGADQTTMQAIAAATGGTHYHADTAADLDSIFREIAASLAVLID